MWALWLSDKKQTLATGSLFVLKKYLCMPIIKYRGESLMKVYLDNCCFNRPYDDQTQIRISLETQAKLYIQDLIRKGQIDLVASYILWYENSRNPYETKRNTIGNFLRKNSAEYVDIDQAEKVKPKAEAIMKTGVKMKDAYHIACAILSFCDYFLTTDDRLLKYNTSEIQMANPLEFVRRLEADLNE